MTKQFTYQSDLPVPAKEAFAWHLRKGALERLLPPWRSVDLSFPPGSPVEEGSQVGLDIGVGPFRVHWLLEHSNYIENQEFTDIQLKGPFKSYSHCHRFLPSGSTSCTLRDEIAFETSCFADRIIAELTRYFSWRHAILKEDLECLCRYSKTPMRLLLSGATGFIGSGLLHFLRLSGIEVVRLVRKVEAHASDAICWDPERGNFQKRDFEGFDAVIHLTGANVGEKRWSPARKEKLFVSRCRDTWVLSQVLSHLDNPPKTVICASAIGFYGDRGEEELTEESAQGTGFLADLCGKWEQSLQSIGGRGARVVHARFGQVLGARGGVLKKMLPAYQMGLGGKMGSGKQWMSWVGIDDLYGALYHILKTEALHGPVNIVAPKPLRQADFAALLAHKLHRPMLGTLPTVLLKGVFGEMAEELLLSSAKAKPAKLLDSGYKFRYQNLLSALKYVC